MTSSVISSAKTGYVFPWMFGKNFDVLFFFAPLLLGFGFLLMSNMQAAGANTFWTLMALNAFGAAPFHWGPTWFAYLDKNNRQYWTNSSSKSIIFFAGPPLIMLVSVLGNLYVSWLITGITILWAVQHLVQQNVGILLLYHNQGKGEAIVNRTVEIRSLHATGIFFSVVAAYRLFLNSPSGLGWMLVLGALLAWAVYSVAVYLIQLRKQVQDGMAVNLPALLFWTCSVLCMVPFAFMGRTFYEAFIIPLTWHWFQYIGLNYMLVKHKYAKGEAPSQNLPNFSKLPAFSLFFATCVFWLGAWLALASTQMGLPAGTVGAKILGGVILGLANCHYFLDAFLWRFRESYQREAVLQYLLRPRRAAKA